MTWTGGRWSLFSWVSIVALIAFYLKKTKKQIHKTVKRVQTRLLLREPLMGVWAWHLEELEQHVVKVGGHVHDADGQLLLACRGAERVLLLPHLNIIILQHRGRLHQGQLFLLSKGFVNIVKHTWHLATL